MTREFQDNDLPDPALDDVNGSETLPGEGYEGEDTEMGNALDGLFGLQQKVQKDLPAVPVVAAAPTPVTIEQPGDFIGRYKLIHKIGEGGMGIVWMAVQFEPVQRRVALKVIKVGMDTREVVARFEAERQALALMQHPNIAQVLDGGATDSGRPYFVMELVEGIPVTEYCNKATLSTGERLRLFMQICEAIQHAHQKGIIHRDIKPSNVLVTNQDGKALPKVIDFGIAKATSQRLTERTLFTQFGQMVGTPAYMSPEQAELTAEDIDTRSDIYSLGVLLYELLTGSTPFEDTKLRQVAVDELCRIIREVEPPKPSARLSTLGRQLLVVAQQRHTDGKKLSHQVHGELDWIAMKALEKDRSRRYQTAAGFAEDVERYLNNEALEAGPPSTMYRFSKFARRNQGVLSAVAVISVVLIAATIISISLAIQERAARKDTERALSVASSAIDDLLEDFGAFELAEVPHAEEIRGRLAEKAQLLSVELSTINPDNTELRELVSRLSSRLSEIHSELGSRSDAVDDALIPRDESIEQVSNDPTNLENLLQLAGNHGALAQRFRENHQLEESESEFRKALDVLVRILVRDQKTSRFLMKSAYINREYGILLTTLGRLEEAEDKLKKAIEQYEETDRGVRTSEDAIGYSACLANLAVVELGNGVPHNALVNLERARKIQDDIASSRQETANFKKFRSMVYINLAIAHSRLGNRQEAVEFYSKADAQFRGLGGDFSKIPAYRRHLATVHLNLSGEFKSLGKTTLAKESASQAIAEFGSLFVDYKIEKDEHLKAMAHSNLGALLEETGDIRAAEEEFNQALEIQKRQLAEFGNDAPGYRYRLARTYHNIGMLWLHVRGLPKPREEFDKAIAASKEAEVHFKKLLTQENRIAYKVDHAVGLSQYGLALQGIGDLGAARKKHLEAVRILKEIVANPEASSSPAHWGYLGLAEQNLALVLFEDSEPKRALSTIDEAIAHGEKATSIDPENTQWRQFLSRQRDLRQEILRSIQ